jgi:hypothetical protein
MLMFSVVLSLYFPPPATQASEASVSTPAKTLGDKAEEKTEETVQEMKSAEEEAKSAEKAAITTAELPKDEAVDKGAEGAVTPKEAKSAAEPESTDKPATAA